jgi:hypothetical protein
MRKVQEPQKIPMRKVVLPPGTHPRIKCDRTLPAEANFLGLGGMGPHSGVQSFQARPRSSACVGRPFCISLVQLNQLTDLCETCYEHHATADHPAFMFFLFYIIKGFGIT